MIKNKGFTLIELLAVIVILAIIALISVPLIMGMIEKTQISAYKESLRNIFDATDIYLATTGFGDIPEEGIDVTDSNFPLKNNGFLNGRIIKNEQGELELNNVTDGHFCGSGTLDNIVVVKETCDITSPVILVDPMTITITKGSAYVDNGVTASDNVDGDLTSDIQVSNTVDSNVAGQYTLTYNVSDSSGNEAQPVTRIVYVSETVRLVFTDSQSWIVPTNVDTVQVLVVGGGGASGGIQTGTGGSGGSGGGGLIYDESYSVSPNDSIPIIIGTGGIYQGGDAYSGQNGEESSFGNLVAVGGGRSASHKYDTLRSGYDGGSGGGGVHSGAGGIATIGQGNNGGQGGYASGGGGGGAGSAGSNASSNAGGNGGAGLDFSSIFGTDVGDNGWFASGGAGGGASSNGIVLPGGGGSVGSHGMANTGGGAGGVTGSGGLSGKNGGSGVVIVKYCLYCGD